MGRTLTSPAHQRRSPPRLFLKRKDLSAFDPVLDLDPSKQRTLPPASRRTEDSPLDGLPSEDESVAHLAQLSHMMARKVRSLYRFPLVIKRVITMKSKGNMPSMYALVVVGNGKGLVGTGDGKDDTAQKAVQKAFTQAVRSMDYVERYEDRIVSGAMKSNFGSCKIEMRSRPPGFGLHVNPYIHQIAKAAGISNLSAKVYGLRNPMRVIKLAVAMLQDMGGFSKEKGQRRNKKTKGMETAKRRPWTCRHSGGGRGE
ncbi:28S ribosomal protein S5, mitochondrial [Rhodotorula kratochvilovae]